MGDRTNTLVPYVPTAACDWDAQAPDARWRAVEGTLVFVDISGFTNLSERLAAKGRIGAEELTSVLNQVFGRMLDVVYQRGGSLLKFGGDALLLMFTTQDHVMQACAATVEMRTVLRTASKEPTSVGRINLRMSSGIHTGKIDLFLVGESHRELLVTGPTASITTDMEATADAGEILISASVAESVPSSFVGEPKGDGWLLRKRSINHPQCGWDPRASHSYDELAQFVSTGLREHLSAGIDDSEHRIATVAFLKFKGIDEAMGRFGAEEVAEMLDELVKTVQRAADEEGITFLASDIDADGGKIILVAGIPSSRHDDEGRVLRAARKIIDSGGRLPIRIGINRGHVFSGNVGTFFRRTYTVMGDTVNLAARLMAAAGPGQIYATPDVLNLSSTLYNSDSLPPFDVKGKSHPIQAFSVLEETGVRPPETASELPFRGRDAELEMLVGIVNTCSRLGRGGVMTISGDTGIGKSRLISEVLEHCPGSDRLLLQAEPSGADNPYWAFRDPMRRQLGVDRSTQPKMARDLRKAISDTAPDLEWALPLLGDVMHIEIEDNEVTRAIDPQFRPQKTADAVIDVLSAGHTRPVAMVAEDGQWLDEASLSLLRRVGEAADTRPWTVMITSRSNDSGFEPMGNEIRLGPLSDEAARSIAIDMTTSTPLRPDELDTIVRKADGNPLFLGEILRVVSKTGSAAELPESLDAVVSSEIDTLSPLTRQALRYSSVLGASFPTAVLDEFLDSEQLGIDDATRTELERFIEADDVAGRMRFKHAVVHDVAYQGLPYRRRKELHARAGSVVERLSGDDPSESAEFLAYQYSEASEHEKVWAYARVAAEKAFHAYANHEAATFYERALRAAGQLGDVSEKEVIDVQEAWGDALERAGLFQDSIRAYGDALRGSSSAVRCADLRLKRARVKAFSGSYTPGLAELTRGTQLVESGHEKTARAARARLISFRSVIRMMQGRSSDALDLAQSALSDAIAADEKQAQARAYMVIDGARLTMGMPSDEDYLEQARSIYEELGDLVGVALATNNMAERAWLEGRLDDAVALLWKADETSRRAGNEPDAARARTNIGEVLIAQGKLEEAMSVLQDASRVLRSHGSEFAVYTDINLGKLALESGEIGESIEILQSALEEANSQGQS
ncbi:MAG TPA: adenylate/guanylate cyclase domain-containing protein, partial [Acidimicrobiia bacterium]|nr:adenylate/guanylate cyclase domain-containing protein [Acidimicrobiia bacterium]